MDKWCPSRPKKIILCIHLLTVYVSKLTIVDTHRDIRLFDTRTQVRPTPKVETYDPFLSHKVINLIGRYQEFNKVTS